MCVVGYRKAIKGRVLSVTRMYSAASLFVTIDVQLFLAGDVLFYFFLP